MPILSRRSTIGLWFNISNSFFLVAINFDLYSENLNLLEDLGIYTVQSYQGLVHVDNQKHKILERIVLLFEWILAAAVNDTAFVVRNRFRMNKTDSEGI